jgi:3-hydroxyisobutyrate dehydrogenase
VTSTAIGFVGLGNMGGRIARVLVDSGRPVLGYDVAADRAPAAGAEPAASPAAVAAATDLILLSLPDGTVVEQVVLGGDGLIDGLIDALHAGQVVVDLSTASPESTRRISARLAELGVDYLDAGISGGASAAEKGTLTLMVGGPPSALEAARPALEVISARIFHCGESGAGHTTKLPNNFLNAVSLAATAEVMVAAKKAGLDLEVLLDVVNHSSGVNFATQNRFPKIVKGDYLQGGLSNTLMLKDVILYTELLGQLGVAGLNASGPVASFGLARALGYADQISNTVVDARGDISGGVRLYDQGERAS